MIAAGPLTHFYGMVNTLVCHEEYSSTSNTKRAIAPQSYTRAFGEAGFTRTRELGCNR